MSLTATLNVSKSALAATQAALQTTGNNIANAADPNYTRQVVRTQPKKDQMVQTGIFKGTGVDLTAIERQIDQALEGRLRFAVSDNSDANTRQQWMGRVESVFNELTDDDLSTRMSEFFNSWGELANKPADLGQRQIVIQSGKTMADRFGNIRTLLGGLRDDVDGQLSSAVATADQLAQRVATLNAQITNAEGGLGAANGLRDQRDAALKSLSELMDVKVFHRESGVADVYVGSEPLVTAGASRGVTLKEETLDGELVRTVVFKADGGTIKLESGTLAGLTTVRSEIDTRAEEVDALAGKFIFEFNRIHASGQGLVGHSSITASNQVDDTAAALNSQAADLLQPPGNGSFVVHVKDKATGLTSSTLIQIDLDGIGADTSLDDLATDLAGVNDISASIVGGKLKLQANSNAVEISFSQDTSGVLASLGINTFFTGADARTMGVNAAVAGDPKMLNAAENGEPGDNGTALTLAALESSDVGNLVGGTLGGAYQNIVNTLATAAAGAREDADASQAVVSTLQSQRDSLSGVSLDEEGMNLIRYQRGYQAAARVIAATDELLQTILNLVR